MTTICCAFLNCYNLYEIGAGRRGTPKTQAALEQKIVNLAATVRAVTVNVVPDIVGLCEVGTFHLAERLAEAISPNTFQIIWRGPSDAAQTGLVVLYKPDVARNVKEESDRSAASGRPKWLAVLLQLQIGTRGPFWFLINHWKSNLGYAAATESARMETARQIGEFYLGNARRDTEAMVLIGDFNCEPWDRPLKQQVPNQLKAVRERGVVLRDRNRLAYFYNPMWRFAGEPDDFDTVQQKGYHAPRVLGTHLPVGKSLGWSVWDQLLVTKPLLAGRLVHFKECTLKVTPAQLHCSDHCAISALFEC